MAGYDYSPRYLNKFPGMPLTDEEQLQYQTPADPMAELPQVDSMPDPGMQVNTPPSVVDPEVQKREALKTYIMQKYNAAADPAGVDQAKADAREMESSANFQQGLGGLLTAKGQAYGGYKPDWTVQNSLRKTAQQGVEDAKGDREQKIQNYLTQNKLQRQGVVEGRDDEQYARINTKGTPEAKLLADKLNKIAPGSVPDTSTVSLADLENIRKSVEFDANLKAKKSTIDTNNAIRLTNISDKKKATLDKDAYTERTKTLADSSPSGRNKYIRDLYNQSGRSVHIEGMVYPDGQPVLDKKGQLVINKMTPQFVEELKQGWAQLLSGGGATSMGEREKLEFKSAYSQAQSLLGYIGNDPKDAGLGSYVRMVADSLNRQKQITENILKEQIAKNFMNAKKWRQSDPEDWKDALYRSTSFNGRPGVNIDTDFDERGLYIPRKLVEAGKGGEGEEFKNMSIGQIIHGHDTAGNKKDFIWTGEGKPIALDEYQKRQGQSTAQNDSPFKASDPFKKAYNWMNSTD